MTDEEFMDLVEREGERFVGAVVCDASWRVVVVQEVYLDIIKAYRDAVLTPWMFTQIAKGVWQITRTQRVIVYLSGAYGWVPRTILSRIIQAHWARRVRC